MNERPGQGMLYLCATPIGNLSDISERVLETLRSVDIIAAEDTRNSLKLLNHFGIKVPLTSYHEYNKYDKANELIDKMADGKSVALITDAGTPAISDPGEVLADMCHNAGIRVTSLPGPCALVTALSMSGMPSRRFVFEGFLPSDKKERKRILEELKDETRTIILYEAPHHLKTTLAQLYETLGDRRIALCRELTKKFEQTIRMRMAEAAVYYKDKEPKGEYVLIIEGRSQSLVDEEKADAWRRKDINEHMALYESEGLDRKEAMKKVAADRGMSKRDVYRQLLEIEENGSKE
ncbi:MAG: 16S rRNA (cytidine(1402)-2'-O)-methyltransferase [Lachnospiraceae bacterium]|nr:16S rRNA (cytidine(1402)-2'-O)-methyltransferase [Lachnospiraceae bacterium]